MPDTAPPVRPLGRRLIAALVAVQILVPAVATIQGVPSKLGFHMFSGYDLWEATATDEDGSDVDLDLGTWVVVPRQDLDWGEYLPAAVCADVPKVAEVRVTQYGDEEVTRCTR